MRAHAWRFHVLITHERVHRKDGILLVVELVKVDTVHHFFNGALRVHVGELVLGGIRHGWRRKLRAQLRVDLGGHRHRGAQDRPDGATRREERVRHCRLPRVVNLSILAAFALAFARAVDAHLEALAVVLEALGVLALATLDVLPCRRHLTLRRGELCVERLRVALEHLLASLVALRQAILRVEAVDTFAAVAEDACGEALAVELEAPRVLAVAQLRPPLPALGFGRLGARQRRQLAGGGTRSALVEQRVDGLVVEERLERLLLRLRRGERGHHLVPFAHPRRSSLCTETERSSICAVHRLAHGVDGTCEQLPARPATRSLARRLICARIGARCAAWCAAADLLERRISTLRNHISTLRIQPREPRRRAHARAWAIAKHAACRRRRLLRRRLLRRRLLRRRLLRHALKRRVGLVGVGLAEDGVKAAAEIKPPREDEGVGVGHGLGLARGEAAVRRKAAAALR